MERMREYPSWASVLFAGVVLTIPDKLTDSGCCFSCPCDILRDWLGIDTASTPCVGFKLPIVDFTRRTILPPGAMASEVGGFWSHRRAGVLQSPLLTKDPRSFAIFEAKVICEWL